jgi:protein-tyrosine phosphatase
VWYNEGVNPRSQLTERMEAALEQLAHHTPGADQLADSLLEELRTALQREPGAGALLGPLLGRLQTVRKARPDAVNLRWIAVGSGCLALGHRPKMKAIPVLRQQGATHVLTLLSETEGAADIGATVQRAGMIWLWFPLESAAPPSAEWDAKVNLLYEGVLAALATGGKIYVHCSAGIHRTGMITHGLLRKMGMSADQALAVLRTLRTETGEGVGEDRLAWGNRFAGASKS